MPFSRRNYDGSMSAKTYPFWKDLIGLLHNNNHTLTQIGEIGEEKLVSDVRFNLQKKDHKKLLAEHDTFISVDTWYPHFAHKLGRPGVVIWGKSDPAIYGYDTHFNIFKDRRYFRKEQFRIWSEEPYDANVFLTADKVLESVETCIKFLNSLKVE